MSDYREHAPVAPLAEFVECAWSVGTAAGTIVADGCMDIVHGHSGDLMVAGADTEARMVERPPGSSAVGLRFRTGVLPRILRVPASELRDERVPLSDLAPALARSLEGPLGETDDPSVRLALLQAALAHAARDATPADPLVDGAVTSLRADPRLPVTDLGDGVGERQLRRRFHAAVGYGPKTLARVLRFQRLQALAHRSGREGLAGLAFAAGYTDQSHMTNEVKRLAGATPGDLFALD